MSLDRAWALTWNRVGPATSPVPLGDDPRIALVTVNFSTTRYLKLMLLTLSQEEHLDLVNRIVIVDNDSRDGGSRFLDRLAERVPHIHVVHRRHHLGHGPGMRAGVRTLDAVETSAKVERTSCCSATPT